VGVGCDLVFMIWFYGRDFQTPLLSPSLALSRTLSLTHINTHTRCRSRSRETPQEVSASRGQPGAARPVVGYFKCQFSKTFQEIWRNLGQKLTNGSKTTPTFQSDPSDTPTKGLVVPEEVRGGASHRRPGAARRLLTPEPHPIRRLCRILAPQTAPIPC